ncbi:hypothetical protein ABZW30_46310 [Kitasatospora sp. NPDC004669]|uniref:telomere-protecting terminal protein Tpg n=1 Tax=Kitasatospora sp. NPDC004669 TaxID=3154555 RepID=UPI0033AEAB9C
MLCGNLYSPSVDSARKGVLAVRAVRAAWQPRVKKRVRRDAEQRGFMLHIQATFGYSAAGGSTDDPRPRMITQKMPGDVARRLYEARDAGATQAQQEAILAEALRDEYFKDGGRRHPPAAPCRRKRASLGRRREAGTFSFEHVGEFTDEIRRNTNERPLPPCASAAGRPCGSPCCATS